MCRPGQTLSGGNWLLPKPASGPGAAMPTAVSSYGGEHTERFAHTIPHIAARALRYRPWKRSGVMADTRRGESAEFAQSQQANRAGEGWK